MDDRGDVWAANCTNEVVVTDPHGIEIGAIDFPGTTTNLAWGGVDGKTLFVTTQEGGVFRLLLTVKETPLRTP